ncbi:hypothetical protein Dimus_038727 [Dionaea muscipula]
MVHPLLSHLHIILSFPAAENIPTLFYPRVEPRAWKRFLNSYEMPFDIIVGANSKANTEAYQPNFAARQLGFYQTRSVPLFYAQSYKGRGVMTKDETTTLQWQRRQLLDRCTVPLMELPLDTSTDLFFNDYWQEEVERIFGRNKTDAMIACLTGKEKKRSRPVGQEKEKRPQKKET